MNRQRLHHQADKIEWVLANPSYKPIEVEPRNLEIQGKVVLVIRQLGMAA